MTGLDIWEVEAFELEHRIDDTARRFYPVLAAQDIANPEYVPGAHYFQMIGGLVGRCEAPVRNDMIAEDIELLEIFRRVYSTDEDSIEQLARNRAVIEQLAHQGRSATSVWGKGGNAFSNEQPIDRLWYLSGGYVYLEPAASQVSSQFFDGFHQAILDVREQALELKLQFTVSVGRPAEDTDAWRLAYLGKEAQSTDLVFPLIDNQIYLFQIGRRLFDKLYELHQNTD